MNPKRLVGLLSLIILVVTIFALGNGPTKTNARFYTSQDTSPQVSTVPEFVVYGLLFKRVSSLSEKTRELRSQGQIAQSGYYPMQKEASLSEEQAKTLEAIASTCQQEVARQDERAGVIIRAFRAQFPGGKIPKGQVLPPPPAELVAMSEERNAIVLRARDQLRLAFGEKSFAQFDNYAKLRYRSTNGPVSPNPVASDSK